MRKLQGICLTRLRTARLVSLAIEVERYPQRSGCHPYCQTRHPDRSQGRRCQEDPHAAETLVGKKVDLDIKEISSPDTDAVLVARNVADQLERRIAYRRAMKRAIQQAMRQGAQGIKIMVGGRLGGGNVPRCLAARWPCASADAAPMWISPRPKPAPPMVNWV